MNANKLYISTCRLVLEADPENDASWSDLSSLLPSLRLALECTACGNILMDPYSPTHEICQHHVCRSCLGAKKKALKPMCSWCKDYDVYSENKQMKLILQCFKKLCQLLKISPIYRKLVDVVRHGGPSDLLDIVSEALNENEALNDSENKLDHLQNKYGRPGDIVQTNHSDPIDPKVEVKIDVDCVDHLIIDPIDNIDDDSNPSTNGEIRTISEDDLGLVPIFKNDNNADLLEDAPVLSPIAEHIEPSENENAPLLSPVPEVRSSNPSSIDYLGNESTDIHINESNKALSASSTCETDLNSDNSSLSSVSSSLEISPALPTQEESSQEAIQDQFREYNLANSLSSESVLEFQGTDLIGATDVNVLESLDETSYSDLADINLSACPLSAIGEENSKDNVISSISDSVLSLPSSVSNVNNHIVVSESSLFCQPLLSPKVEVHDEVDSCITSVTSLPSTADSKPNSRLSENSFSTVNNIIGINLSESNIFSSDALDTLVNRSSSDNILPLSSVNSIISQSINVPSQMQVSFCKTEPSSNFITSHVNSHVISPHMSVSSNRNINFSPVHNSSTSINQALSPALVETSMSCSSLQNSVLSSDIVQQPITSHHLIHKQSSSTQIIQKSLHPQHLSQSSVQPCQLTGTANVIVNHPSSGDLMVISPPQQSLQQQAHIIQSHPCVSTQNIETSIAQQHKIACSTNLSTSNISNASPSITPANSLSSNFLNILSPGAIFQSTNLTSKLSNKETQIKTAPVLSNGSSMYSVMFSEEDSTKITIKRTPPDNKPYISNITATGLKSPNNQIRHDQVRNITIANACMNQNQNILKRPPKPKAKPKPKPKRKGCRCGNATPSPGKLTCCGQRCPCYVEAKACIDCRCKGCRNPHRPGGKKVRPVIPHQANIQIHQIQPVLNRTVPTSLPKSSGVPATPVTMNIHPFQHHSNIQTPGNQCATSSAPQTFRTFQTIHAVKTVPGLNSVQGLIGSNQVFNVKDCILDNKFSSSISQDSVVPVTNIISMKPIKVRLDSIPSNVLRNDKFSPSGDSDSEIDINM